MVEVLLTLAQCQDNPFDALKDKTDATASPADKVVASPHKWVNCWNVSNGIGHCGTHYFLIHFYEILFIIFVGYSNPWSVIMSINCMALHFYLTHLMFVLWSFQPFTFMSIAVILT